MTRVLVVDHMLFARELRAALEAVPDLQVQCCEPAPEQVVQTVQKTRPQVLALGLRGVRQAALDIVMRVMRECPTPIVMLAAADGSEAHLCFQAMEAGALAVQQWPDSTTAGQKLAAFTSLVGTLRAMSEVKVVRRWARRAAPQPSAADAQARLAVIGGSTGAPGALRDILTQLPPGFPLPVVIVQHMAAGFLPAFAQWLEKASGFPVSVAQDGKLLAPGRAWLAPDGRQLGVTRELRARLMAAPAEHGMCPSVSYLFRSVPEDLRAATAAVLLTGMGRDGASELKQLKDGGALTVVQDRASSAVYGMPGEALRQDAAMLILAPHDIGRALCGFASGAPLALLPPTGRGEHG